MSRTKKIWLGILTFLPILFVIAYFIFFFMFFFSSTSGLHEVEQFEPNTHELPATYVANFAILFALILLAGFISIGLIIYYVIHANNNPKNDSNKKLMWILVLVFTSSIGSIVYYFVEILPLPNDNPMGSIKS